MVKPSIRHDLRNPYYFLDNFDFGYRLLYWRTNEEITKTIQERQAQIEEITQEFHLGIAEGFPGQSKREYFESKVNSILNKTIDKFKKFQKGTLSRFLTAI